MINNTNTNMAEIPIIAGKILATGFTMASTPVVRGVLSTGSGLYSGKQVYDAIKNRKKKILKKRKAQIEIDL